MFFSFWLLWCSSGVLPGAGVVLCSTDKNPEARTRTEKIPEEHQKRGGLKRKLEYRPKHHAPIFDGIPSFLLSRVIDPKPKAQVARKPLSHAFALLRDQFGKAGCREP